NTITGAGGGTIFGGAGSDLLIGGVGDTIYAGTGADTLNGSAGSDIANFSNVGAAITFSTANETAIFGGLTSITDTLLGSFGSVIGGASNDVFQWNNPL